MRVVRVQVCRADLSVWSRASRLVAAVMDCRRRSVFAMMLPQRQCELSSRLQGCVGASSCHDLLCHGDYVRQSPQAEVAKEQCG